MMKKVNYDHTAETIPTVVNNHLEEMREIFHLIFDSGLANCSERYNSENEDDDHEGRVKS